jgi:hypothetical protein
MVMKDRRNEYRIMAINTHWSYALQVKRWWFPFWRTIKVSDSKRNLELIANDHATPFLYIGKLPKTEEELSLLEKMNRRTGRL